MKLSELNAIATASKLDDPDVMLSLGGKLIPVEDGGVADFGRVLCVKAWQAS